MSPAESKRTITARSAKLPAVPVDRPVPPSMSAPLGVASNAAVNDPVCVANAVFCHVAELVVQVPGGDAGTTVTAAAPLCPSIVAVMVAEPAVTPATSPLALTVAMFVLLEAQVTVRPDSGFPLASRGVAVSGTVLPSFTEALAGVTDTDATGTRQPPTVTVAASERSPG